MNIYLSEHQYTRLSNRWTSVITQPDWKEGFDAPVIPLLEQMNKKAGLVTIFSCSGHLDKRGRDDFYIMAGVLNAQGADHFSDFHTRFKRWFKQKHDFGLSTAEHEQLRLRLRMTFTERHDVTRHEDKGQAWYNVGLISGILPSSEEYFNAMWDFVSKP